MDDFKSIFLKKQNEIEKILSFYSSKQLSHYNQTIIEAMNYSLMSGGKRIRPIFLLETYKLFSDHTIIVEPFMAAIEMIHTYSLIHDDLPAMDNDDLRRGLATCHIKFGENIAILAGDGLLNRAFEVMIEGTLEHSLGDRGLKAAKCLGNKSGTYGMLGGQATDIIYEGCAMDMDTLTFIHKHKTSALIEASFMMGGYLANQEVDVVEKLERLGACIGMAFQIQDDLLDVYGNVEELGKIPMSDKKNKKTTYIDIKGVAESRNSVNDLLDEAMVLLHEFDYDRTKYLEAFITFLRERRY